MKRQVSMAALGACLGALAPAPGMAGEPLGPRPWRSPCASRAGRSSGSKARVCGCTRRREGRAAPPGRQGRRWSRHHRRSRHRWRVQWRPRRRHAWTWMRCAGWGGGSNGPVTVRPCSILRYRLRRHPRLRGRSSAEMPREVCCRCRLRRPHHPYRPRLRHRWRHPSRHPRRHPRCQQRQYQRRHRQPGLASRSLISMPSCENGAGRSSATRRDPLYFVQGWRIPPPRPSPRVRGS